MKLDQNRCDPHYNLTKKQSAPTLRKIETNKKFSNIKMRKPGDLDGKNAIGVKYSNADLIQESVFEPQSLYANRMQ